MALFTPFMLVTLLAAPAPAPTPEPTLRSIPELPHPTEVDEPVPPPVAPPLLDATPHAGPAKGLPLVPPTLPLPEREVRREVEREAKPEFISAPQAVEDESPLHQERGRVRSLAAIADARRPMLRAARTRNWGIGLLISSYGVTALAGLYQINSYDRRSQAFAGLLMTPVVGPFGAIGYAPSTRGALWAGLSGVMQSGSLAMIVAGEHRRRRFQRELPVFVSAVPTQGGGHASVRVRF